MVMITDRLITVERKMLHLERELHIVKLQQSSPGRHPLCTIQTTTPVCPQHTALPALSRSILHCHPCRQHTALPPLPIYNPHIRHRGQFHNHEPTVPQINHSYNQHHHLSCHRQFHPL